MLSKVVSARQLRSAHSLLAFGIAVMLAPATALAGTPLICHPYAIGAAKLRGPDPEMEFALALASSWPNRRKEHADHLARARAGAPKGSLLATNLASHFSGS